MGEGAQGFKNKDHSIIKSNIMDSFLSKSTWYDQDVKDVNF